MGRVIDDTAGVIGLGDFHGVRVLVDLRVICGITRGSWGGRVSRTLLKCKHSVAGVFLQLFSVYGWLFTLFCGIFRGKCGCGLQRVYLCHVQILWGRVTWIVVCWKSVVVSKLRHTDPVGRAHFFQWLPDHSYSDKMHHYSENATRPHIPTPLLKCTRSPIAVTTTSTRDQPLTT